MKSMTKIIAVAALTVALFSFKSAPVVKADPTTPPYVQAIPWYQFQVNVWVHWDYNANVSRDYYADVLVTYNDDCGTGHTKIVTVIIPAGNWTGWDDFDTCFHMTVTDYSIVSWGPM